MSFVKWTFLCLLLLPIAEIAAFVLVMLVLGLMWAFLLLVATTFLGILVLKRSGRADLNRFLAALNRQGIRAIHLETPGLGTILGGILLVFPGFITDVIGALLFIAPLRRWVAGAIGRKLHQQRARRHSSVIDLEAGEWRQVTDATAENKRR